jgi:hypothetical protein
MNSLRNDAYDLFVITHVQIKIYREFYHKHVYIAIEGRHVRINFYIPCINSVVYLVYFSSIICYLS